MTKEQIEALTPEELVLNPVVQKLVEALLKCDHIVLENDVHFMAGRTEIKEALAPFIGEDGK